MTTVLFSKDDLEFCVSDMFEGRFLIPLLENMREKMLSGVWDDYNELRHCCKLIHDFSQIPGLVMDFHTMRRGEEPLGVVLVTHGRIPPDIYASSGLHISDPVHEVLLLNYFHIAPAGRGNGTFWLQNIIMPMYAEQGYSAIYLKSSHTKSFPLYDRLGTVIGNYTTSSDNDKYRRTGRLYRLPLFDKLFSKDH